MRPSVFIIPGMLLIAALWAAGLAIVWPDAEPETPEVVLQEAYGVVSACGIYAVVHVYSDATTKYFWTENPETQAELAAVAALPEEARTTIIVPCPPGAAQAFPQALEL